MGKKSKKQSVKQVTGTFLVESSGSRKAKHGYIAKFLVDGKDNPGQLSGIYPESKSHDKAHVTRYYEGNQTLALVLDDGTVIYGKIPEKVDEEVKVKLPITVEKVDEGTDGFHVRHSLLPKRTRDALGSFREIDNFHLQFYKAARYDLPGDEEQGGEKKFQPIISAKKELKYLLTPNFDRDAFPAILQRNEATARAIGYGTEEKPLLSLQATSLWRWIVGLGNASVYENGMTLHHVYGIPYIPGSGVKGMLRTWMITECFEQKEEIALKNEVFRRIFGHGNLGESQGQKGKVVFFDTFPTREVSIEPDIMNNHYQDYYEGDAPPADWLQPNPIFFMTACGGTLHFLLGIEDNAPLGEAAGPFLEARSDSNLNSASSIEELLRFWLADALENHGIGAKTAVGYGRMVAS